MNTGRGESKLRLLVVVMVVVGGGRWRKKRVEGDWRRRRMGQGTKQEVTRRVDEASFKSSWKSKARWDMRRGGEEEQGKRKRCV